MAIETFPDFVVEGPHGKKREITDVQFFLHLGQVTFCVDGASEQFFSSQFLNGAMPKEKAIVDAVRTMVLREWDAYPKPHLNFEYVISVDGLPEGFSSERAYEWKEGNFLILLKPDRAGQRGDDIANPQGFRVFIGDFQEGASEVLERILVQELTLPGKETQIYVRFYHNGQPMTINLPTSGRTNPLLQIGTGPIQELSKSFPIQRR